MSIELDSTLALTAKLQAAEARALAAETTIAAALQHWTLTAGTSWPLSPMAAILQRIDVAAAREMMRKAGEWDKVSNDYPTDAEAAEMHKALGGPAECTTFGPTAMQRQEDQRERRKHDPDFVLPLSEYRALRTERDELAALVEAILTENEEDAEFVAKVIGDPDDCHYPPAILRDTVAKYRALTPPAALADLRQRVRVEVLEEVALMLDAEAAHLAELAKQAYSRRHPATAMINDTRRESCLLIGAKIRAMKEAQ